MVKICSFWQILKSWGLGLWLSKVFQTKDQWFIYIYPVHRSINKVSRKTRHHIYVLTVSKYCQSQKYSRIVIVTNQMSLLRKIDHAKVLSIGGADAWPPNIHTRFRCVSFTPFNRTNINGGVIFFFIQILPADWILFKLPINNWQYKNK